MRRRSYLKAAWVGAGALAMGAVQRGVSEVQSANSQSGVATRTANELVSKSFDELEAMSNDEIKGPFDPHVGSASAYDADGFEGYLQHGPTITKADADAVVTSVSGLKSELDSASSGDVIWVDADLDLSGESGIGIPGGVTLASGRGQDGWAGARLYAEKNATPLFVTEGSGVRLTGLRLVSDERSYYTLDERNADSIYDVGEDRALTVKHNNVEVDNCLFAGWIHTCIEVDRSGTSNPNDYSTYVHHNDLIDTPSPGLGYGVAVTVGNPIISYNYFDRNRHAITGSGHEDCNYVVRYNLFGPRTRSHVLDMHGEDVSGQEAKRAGRRFSVHHNVVIAKRHMEKGHVLSSMRVRGVPSNGGQILSNWFFSDQVPSNADGSDDTDGDVVYQYNDGGVDRRFVDLTVYNNFYGKEAHVGDVGIETRWATSL